MSSRKHKPHKLKAPKYSLHRGTGQARVRLGGRDHYLGKYGSPESRERYARLVEQHLAGRPVADEPRGRRPVTVTVRTVLHAYLEHAGGYYVKAGRVTDQLSVIESAFRPVLGRHGDTAASDFGPKALKDCRGDMVASGWCRNYVNKATGCVVRAWSWAVTEELVRGESAAALREVPPLRPGEQGVRESEPRGPVPGDVLEKALPHLPAAVADLLRTQYLAGMRPVEACHLRWRHVDRDGRVPGGPQFPGLWVYAVPPEANKNWHRGKDRIVFLGPEAQAVLGAYLDRDPDEYLFGRGGRPHDARSLHKAIRRACAAAGVPPFGANQVRHSRATDLDRLGGLDDAQATLGHASAETTRRYARTSQELKALERAAAAMRRVG